MNLAGPVLSKPIAAAKAASKFLDHDHFLRGDATNSYVSPQNELLLFNLRLIIEASKMKTKLLIFSVCAAFALTTQTASAKGCIKGAAVGGVAGHVAGHHGVLGAAGGCLIGRYRANKQAKENVAEQAQTSAARKKTTAAQPVSSTPSRQ